jgi:ferredoxin
VSDRMTVKLDRTRCDGFGICAKHAPEYFSLDDWGYASLIGDGDVADADRDMVLRALLDCPVHAITEVGDRRVSNGSPAPSAAYDSLPSLKIEDNEAEWGFER